MSGLLSRSGAVCFSQSLGRAHPVVRRTLLLALLYPRANHSIPTFLLGAYGGWISFPRAPLYDPRVCRSQCRALMVRALPVGGIAI